MKLKIKKSMLKEMIDAALNEAKLSNEQKVDIIYKINTDLKSVLIKAFGDAGQRTMTPYSGRSIGPNVLQIDLQTGSGRDGIQFYIYKDKQFRSKFKLKHSNQIYPLMEKAINKYLHGNEHIDSVTYKDEKDHASRDLTTLKFKINWKK